MKSERAVAIAVFRLALSRSQRLTGFTVLPQLIVAQGGLPVILHIPAIEMGSFICHCRSHGWDLPFSRASRIVNVDGNGWVDLPTFELIFARSRLLPKDLIAEPAVQVHSTSETGRISETKTPGCC